MSRRNMISPLAVSVLAITLVTNTIYYSHWRKARTIAQSIYGDHLAPLTETEKKEWYEDMGLVNSEPTDYELRKFLRVYSKTEIH